jgi:hypothetical protein
MLKACLILFQFELPTVCRGVEIFEQRSSTGRSDAVSRHDEMLSMHITHSGHGRNSNDEGYPAVCDAYQLAPDKWSDGQAFCLEDISGNWRAAVTF